MDKRIINLLKNINDGKFSGSQRKLAKLLGVSDTSVSTWCRKEKKPSLDMIAKMAKIFEISEEETERIFTEKEDAADNDGKMKDEEIRLLKERIKFLEEQLVFYKRNS